MEKFGGYKTEVKERIEKKEMASVKKEGGRGRTVRGMREVMRRDWNENVVTRPNELRENAETSTSCRGRRPARKKAEVVYQ